MPNCALFVGPCVPATVVGASGAKLEGAWVSEPEGEVVAAPIVETAVGG